MKRRQRTGGLARLPVIVRRGPGPFSATWEKFQNAALEDVLKAALEVGETSFTIPLQTLVGETDSRMAEALERRDEAARPCGAKGAKGGREDQILHPAGSVTKADLGRIAAEMDPARRRRLTAMVAERAGVKPKSVQKRVAKFSRKPKSDQ